MNTNCREIFAVTALTLIGLGTALPAVAQSPGESTEELEEIVVTAHKREYLATSAETPLGLDLSILEMPAAASVISQDLLKDLQVNNVDEALRNVAGVTKLKLGNGGAESFAIRGFGVGGLYKDGAPNNNSLNAVVIPSTETANLERIEVLKGPSALLYGAGEPGGIINYITKRPDFERYGSVEVLAGSDAFYKVEFDATGAVSGSDRVAYRVVGSYEDSESFQDELGRQRLMLNPSLLFSASEDLQLLLSLEYTDDDFTQTRGQVLDGNLFTGFFYSDRQDPSQFYGVPGFNDQTETTSVRANLVLDYRVNDIWDTRLTYNHVENDKQLFDSQPGIIDFSVFGIIGGEGTPFENLIVMDGSNSSDSTGNADQITLQNFLEFDGPLSTRHRLLFSYTHEAFDADSQGFSSSDLVFYNIVTDQYFFATPTNPVNPGDISISLVPTGDGVITDVEETGINLVDFIDLNDRFSVLIGARYSDYEDKLSGFEDDDLSIRAGLVYKARSDLSFYLSYAEGYNSSGGSLDINDNPIEPETSESWEIGAKWEVVSGRLLVTGVLYDTAKQDIPFIVNPLAAPIDIRFGNIGEVESQGVELEVVGNINENWRIQAGYSYIDNEITEGGTGMMSFGPISFALIEGNSLAGIADHNFNLSSFYELELGAGRLGLGGSLYAQSDSFISGENNFEIDAWQQVDLAAYYKWDKWKAQLNVRNVFDEEYLLTQGQVTPDIFAAIRIAPAAPTTWVASLSYEF